MKISSFHTIHTVGYEGETIDNFITKLKENKIRILVDIRELPLSRKKGFSKSQLSNHLENNKIEYFNIRELGSPRDVRHFYYESGDFEAFRIEYLNYIRNQETKISELLLLVKNYSNKGNVGVMCFEKDHEKCHRSVLLDYIQKKFSPDIKICHI